MNRLFSLFRPMLSLALILALLFGPCALAEDSADALPEAEPVSEESAAEEDFRAYVLVYVGGYPYAIEPLDTDRDVTIAQPTGETNVVHITHNGFHMASSTCDNQLCVGEGEVTLDNYMSRILGPYVLCLPNQVQLQLVVISAEAAE